MVRPRGKPLDKAHSSAANFADMHVSLSAVLSFMTQWGGGAPKSPHTSTPASPSFNKPESPVPGSTPTFEDGRMDGAARINGTPQRASRPPSISSPMNYPAMDPASLDTPPELQPIFSYLSSHSNKLYQEGYFLKLHDLDSRE